MIAQIDELDNDDHIQSVDASTTKGSVTTTPTVAKIVKKFPSEDNDVGIDETPRSSGGFKVSLDNSLFFDDDDTGVGNDDVDDTDVGNDDVPALRCYSCGSLLSGNQNCTQFNATDPRQIQFCKPDEACLMYSWSKSDTQRGNL